MLLGQCLLTFVLVHCKSPGAFASKCPKWLQGAPLLLPGSRLGPLLVGRVAGPALLHDLFNDILCSRGRSPTLFGPSPLASKSQHGEPDTTCFTAKFRIYNNQTWSTPGASEGTQKEDHRHQKAPEGVQKVAKRCPKVPKRCRRNSVANHSF